MGVPCRGVPFRDGVPPPPLRGVPLFAPPTRVGVPLRSLADRESARVRVVDFALDFETFERAFSRESSAHSAAPLSAQMRARTWAAPVVRPPASLS